VRLAKDALQAFGVAGEILCNAQAPAEIGDGRPMAGAGVGIDESGGRVPGTDPGTAIEKASSNKAVLPNNRST